MQATCTPRRLSTLSVLLLSLSVVVLLLSFSLLNFSNSLQTTLYNTRGSLYTRSILLFDRWRHLIKYWFWTQPRCALIECILRIKWSWLTCKLKHHVIMQICGFKLRKIVRLHLYSNFVMFISKHRFSIIYFRNVPPFDLF